MAKYELENSLIASASRVPVNNTGTSTFFDPDNSKFAIFFAFSERSPTTMREGYKLSFKARPSLKNSGEKIMLEVLKCARCVSTKPIGMVDFMMMMHFGAILVTSVMTFSTDVVSKTFVEEL